MRAQPPTVKQLLVLADRAERGPLTAAEASRLREGIAALESSRRSMHASLARQAQLRQQDTSRLAPFRSVVRRARARGGRTVAVWVLERLLADAETTPEARQQEAA